jgi:CheY-like chemotaxis protein
MSTVLVVEDDVDLRELVVTILEDQGYAVETAADGREGLDHVATRMPDLVLLDMKMPVMSGEEFAAAYQARYAPAIRAPIVVVTAAEHAARRAREIGADGFLAKPYSNEELRRIVAKHLARSPAEMHPAASPS